jgi:hypothetical protein
MVLFCCGTSTLAQVSKPWERCLETVSRDVTAVPRISSEPGLQYRLGALTVDPADSEKVLSLKPQALRSEFRLQTNEILNVGEVRNGLSRLTKIYCKFGFIDVTTEPGFKIDDAKRTIDVAILVDEGRQYFVNDVQFWGVDAKLETRLRRKLPRGSWLFNSAVLENFFRENRSMLPADASPGDNVEFHRDTKGATVALLFDFAPGRSKRTLVQPKTRKCVNRKG